LSRQHSEHSASAARKRAVTFSIPRRAHPLAEGGKTACLVRRRGAFFPLAESATALLGGVDLDLALDELMARFHHHVQDGLTDDVAVALIAWAPELQLSEIAPGVNDSVADPRDRLKDRGFSQFPP